MQLGLECYYSHFFSSMQSYALKNFTETHFTATITPLDKILPLPYNIWNTVYLPMHSIHKNTQYSYENIFS